MKLLRKLFSKKKESNKNSDSGVKNIALGTGLAVGSGVLGNEVIERSGNYLFNSKLTAKDKDIVKDKLLKSAKDQGIKVVNDPNGSNAVYVGSKEGSQARDLFAKGVKKLRKGGMSNKEIKDILGSVKESTNQSAGLDKMFDNLGKDTVILGKGNLSEADVLSHELGHAQYMKKGRSKSKLGKISHKLMPVSKLGTSPVGGVAAAINGFKSGQKSVKAKREGKKESTWNKIRAVAVPAALAAPLLIGEGKASLNGLRAMKKAGASKELMNQSKKRLLAAYGTYAGHASKNVVLGAAAREIGKGYEKLKGKDK